MKVKVRKADLMTGYKMLSFVPIRSGKSCYWVRIKL